jgi:hypothetical protein
VVKHQENQLRNPPLWRVVLAFVVAPLAPVNAILALMALPALAGAEVALIIAVAGTFLLGVVIPPTILLGVPAYFLARHLTTLTRGLTVVAGALVAFFGITAQFMALGLGSANWRPDDLLSSLSLGAMGILPGALAGWVFWLVLAGWPTSRWLRRDLS